MPIFLQLYGLSFFSLVYDLVKEPFHVHVQQGSKLCKYWIFEDGGIELSKNKGYKNAELSRIEKTLWENSTFVIDKYKTYCHENRLTPNYKTKRTA